MNQEIVDTLVAANNEGTRSPWWVILDPRQNMSCDLHVLGAMIDGPFFSRKDAEAFLAATYYNFSDKAVVYCLSGCHSRKYDEFYNAFVKPKKLNDL